MKLRFTNKTTLLLAFLAAMTHQLSAHNGVKVSPKMFLKGALESNGLMRDALRTKGLLPSTEPYSALPNFHHYGNGGGESIASPAVFQVAGNNAIVDWVVVELRSENSLSTPVSTHAALLQRDGDVVGMDGASPVHFYDVAPGQYHVSVRHRNHLGVMTSEAFSLNSTTTFVDFSNPMVALYGNNPAGMVDGKQVLWLGDGNRDKKTVYQGPGNDIFALFSLVMNSSGNTGGNANYAAKGYFLTDFNLDGYAIFNGPSNDRSVLFLQAWLGCGANNCFFTEQIP